MEAEDNKISERDVIRSTRYPNTITTLKHDYKSLGIRPGLVVIMGGLLVVRLLL